MKMLLRTFLVTGCLVLAGAGTSRATIIADWTFETSAPTTAGSFNPEVGTGSATGFHSGSTTYSSPAGNGSAHSFSSTDWLVGDYYQFQVSTIGDTGIVISWDQTSSGTGPGSFTLQYSLNGTSFTTFGSAYTVLANASPNPAWNATTSSSLYSYNVNLSSITALNNATSVYFRLVDNSTTAAGGGTVGTTGTDRVDNFEVQSDLAAVPEASTLYGGIALSLGMLASLVRKMRK